MRDHLFISYRRDDARGASGRLYDWLRIAFGRDRVFRDVHSIGAGRWRDTIDHALARSAVCVAVLGRRWADTDNLPRLHADDDMVRHELLQALAASADGLVLVPTLVEDAALPPVAALPAALRPVLADWNVRAISESGWEDDTRRLIAEIAAAARLQVRADVGQLLQTVAAAGEQLATLEAERRLQADQIATLRATVDDLTRQLAEARTAEDRSVAAEAFAALARGDTLAAEQAFERASERHDRAEQSARLARAEALRQVAHLANLRDVRKAVLFYRKALQAQPDHAETARALGLALIDLGDLTGARQALQTALDTARGEGDAWWEMAALNGLGQVLAAQGDRPGAFAAFRADMAIAESLAARDRGNADWQRDLSVSHDRIGEVLVAQGEQLGALAAFRASIAIRETLAARDPGHAGWQVDVAVSCAKLGASAALPLEERRAHWLRGLDTLARLAAANRLAPSHDHRAWFERALSELGGTT